MVLDDDGDSSIVQSQIRSVETITITFMRVYSNLMESALYHVDVF